MADHLETLLRQKVADLSQGAAELVRLVAGRCPNCDGTGAVTVTGTGLGHAAGCCGDACDQAGCPVPEPVPAAAPCPACWWVLDFARELEGPGAGA
jgi:hypothetical protein